jgi:hypothetical protein
MHFNLFLFTDKAYCVELINFGLELVLGAVTCIFGQSFCWHGGGVVFGGGSKLNDHNFLLLLLPQEQV